MQFARLTLEICGNNTTSSSASITGKRRFGQCLQMHFLYASRESASTCNVAPYRQMSETTTTTTTTSSQAVTMTGWDRERDARLPTCNWQLATRGVPLAATSGQVAASKQN